MKLNERLRIAWQVLTKGTCDELQEAEQEKKEAKKAKERMLRHAETFQDGIDMMGLKMRGFVGNPHGIEHVTLSYIDVPIFSRGSDPYSRIENDTYTLARIDVERTGIEAIERNAMLLERMKADAVMSLARELVKRGVLHISVDEYFDHYSHRLRVSVPFYTMYHNK